MLLVSPHKGILSYSSAFVFAFVSEQQNIKGSVIFPEHFSTAETQKLQPQILHKIQ